MAAASLLLQIMPVVSRARSSTEPPSRAELTVCAALSRAVYEDLAPALGDGSGFDTLGWVLDEEHRRRALRAIERADDALLDVVDCYEDLPGAHAGESDAHKARDVLVDWYLLYEDAAPRDTLPNWYDLVVAVNLL